MPAPQAQPSLEEILFYVRQEAARRGIDPDIAERIVKSELGETEGTWQSNYYNKKGEREKSYGPFQLNDKGMGAEYTAATGFNARDPSNWRHQVDFALDRAGAEEAPGKEGWGPWYGAERVGIAQFEGLPRGQATGRRGRASEVSQTAGPMVPPMFVQPVGSVKEKRSELPKSQERVAAEWKPQKLGGALASMFGYQPEADKWGDYNEDATLAGMLFNRGQTGTDKEIAEATDLKGTNKYAMGPVENQVQRQKKTNKMATIADYFYPTELEDPNKKKTLAGGILNMFGFG